MNKKLIHIPILVLMAGLISPCIYEERCMSSNKSKKRCDACEDSFMNKNNGCCNFNIPKKIEHCKRYDVKEGDIICIECTGGYIFSKNFKSCIKCEVEDCAKCEVDQKCMACFNKLKLNQKDNKCDSNLQMCDIPNCDICALGRKGEYCHEWSNGFALDVDNEFSGCIEAPPNCRWGIKNDDGYKCYLCHFGFYNTEDGKCAPNSSFHLIAARILDFFGLPSTSFSKFKIMV